jgi:hypothetical protein
MDGIDEVVFSLLALVGENGQASGGTINIFIYIVGLGVRI